jgi:hypothetical protein
MCNGLCEKFNGVLKKMLKAYARSKPKTCTVFVSVLLVSHFQWQALPLFSSFLLCLINDLIQNLDQEASTVSNALISLFSRVGIPKEMLTDQGNNFMSELMCRQ